MPCASGGSSPATYAVEVASRRSRREAEPVRITTAPQSRHDDLNRRRKRYVISMTIRTICFVLAVAWPIFWMKWIFVAGALILPYVAVVMANSASPRIPGTDLVTVQGGHKELG